MGDVKIILYLCCKETFGNPIIIHFIIISEMNKSASVCNTWYWQVWVTYWQYWIKLKFNSETTGKFNNKFNKILLVKQNFIIYRTPWASFFKGP